MKPTAILASLLLLPGAILPGAAFAQEPKAPAGSDEVMTATTGLVTITSKGADVRSVLYDLFSQAGRSFVLEPNVRFVLYLHLKDVEFDEALGIVLKTASLKVDKQNGIAFISTRRPGDLEPKAAATAPAPAPKPAGKLAPSDLQKRLTTRYRITDLDVVLKEFSRQTGVRIDLGSGLPNVKIDAFLIDTSLKFALDSVCEAVGLKYVLTDNKGIRIEKKA